jgi:hypothetical protein
VTFDVGRATHAAIAIVLAIVTVTACARPVMTPSTPMGSAPAGLASLAVAATGTKPCGIVPDWGCMYVIQVQGPEGAVHEGWFDEGVIVGDVPMQLGEGGYRITFLKQRVSDVSSQVPVPGGTPRLSNRSDVFATCATSVDVTGPADIRVEVAFAESTCTTTTTSTEG